MSLPFLVSSDILLSKRMLNFVEGFFCIYWESLILFTCCIMFIDLHMWYHPCIPGMKSTWSWYNLSNMFDSASKYFIKGFCIYVHQGYWPTTFFLDASLPCFGIRVILASENEFGRIPSSCILWNHLRNIGVGSWKVL
jgi:hypothetical protein